MEQGFDLGRGEQWEDQGVIQVNLDFAMSWVIKVQTAGTVWPEQGSSLWSTF